MSNTVSSSEVWSNFKVRLEEAFSLVQPNYGNRELLLANYRSLVKRILQGNLEKFSATSSHVFIPANNETITTKHEIVINLINPITKSFSGWKINKKKEYKTPKPITIKVDFPKSVTIKFDKTGIHFTATEAKNLPKRQTQRWNRYLRNNLHMSDAVYSSGPGDTGSIFAMYLRFTYVHKERSYSCIAGGSKWFKIANLPADLPAPKLGPSFLKNLVLKTLHDHEIDCKYVPPILMQPKLSAEGHQN